MGRERRPPVFGAVALHGEPSPILVSWLKRYYPPGGCQGITLDSEALFLALVKAGSWMSERMDLF
jgi:hypothetical protein